VDLSQLLLAAGHAKLLEALQDPQLLQKCLQNPGYLNDLSKLNVIPTPLLPSASDTTQATPRAAAGLLPKDLLFQLLDEFLAKDEGKQLVAGLGAFTSYVQRRMSKRGGQDEARTSGAGGG
jgi:hypothetical protein